MGRQKSLQSLKGEENMRCPECGSKHIAKDGGEIYCEKCGFVLEE